MASHKLSEQDRLRLYQTKSVCAWGRYEGQLKRAIALMKYQCQPEIGNLLGRELAKTWKENNLGKPESKVSVVPIPMHANKEQERGFNQAEIIARSFCQLTGYRLETKVLSRIRATEAMFNLSSKAARERNLRKAIRVEKRPKHAVLLIDDIYTTGTTVNETVRVLQQKQIKVIGVAVVAKAGALA
ncbi:MAG: ComF family protein [Cyanobacteria bacterium J06623_7]